MILKWSPLIFTLFMLPAFSGDPEPDWNFNNQLMHYFENQVAQIEHENSLTNWQSQEDFKLFQVEAREELWDMLGMSPHPVKSDLRVRITGIVEHEHFVVEKIVFESVPGLYVTGNLYRPKQIENPLPAILYVCGHATVEKDGYNYGAKAHYQHHPAWYARNGYICLILDTVQLGEIEGIHHGTYRYNRWWWMSAGYTPAGIEAWNGIRAIDYLVSRRDVDASRLGVTGRSGGGATSWWVGALDERIKVVVPVAGITDLHNHVIDGCVEGHCDCMYFANTYRWDYPKLGALVAPRPLLIANADRDAIFPLDGVYRTYQAINEVYEKLEVPDLLALNIVGGGHRDIQEVQIHPFRWFNHFLRETDTLVDLPAIKYMTPEQLRVLDQIPANPLNATIDESFVPQAPSFIERLQNQDFNQLKKQWLAQIDSLVFGGWPSPIPDAAIKLHLEQKSDKVSMQLYQLNTEAGIHLPLIVLTHQEATAQNGAIRILDDAVWQRLKPAIGGLFGEQELWPESMETEAAKSLSDELRQKGKIIYLPVRGAGISAYSGDQRKQTHIQRRYYLVGQTLEGMQTFDIVQGIRAMEKVQPEVKIIEASGNTAIMTVYAVLHQSGYRLVLQQPGTSHRTGPYYLNVLRYLDVPEAILMASQANDIYLETGETDFVELKRYIADHQGFRLHF